LNQAIRKEDKDLIMKNIIAYQQMIGQQPSGLGKSNSAQSGVLSQQQLA